MMRLADGTATSMARSKAIDQEQPVEIHKRFNSEEATDPAKRNWLSGHLKSFILLSTSKEWGINITKINQILSLKKTYKIWCRLKDKISLLDWTKTRNSDLTRISIRKNHLSKLAAQQEKLKRSEKEAI